MEQASNIVILSAAKQPHSRLIIRNSSFRILFEIRIATCSSRDARTCTVRACCKVIEVIRTLRCV